MWDSLWVWRSRVKIALVLTVFLFSFDPKDGGNRLPKCSSQSNQNTQSSIPQDIMRDTWNYCLLHPHVIKRTNHQRFESTDRDTDLTNVSPTDSELCGSVHWITSMWIRVRKEQLSTGLFPHLVPCRTYASIHGLCCKLLAPSLYFILQLPVSRVLQCRLQFIHFYPLGEGEFALSTSDHLSFIHR